MLQQCYGIVSIDFQDTVCEGVVVRSVCFTVVGVQQCRHDSLVSHTTSRFEDKAEIRRETLEYR